MPLLPFFVDTDGTRARETLRPVGAESSIRLAWEKIAPHVV